MWSLGLIHAVAPFLIKHQLHRYVLVDQLEKFMPGNDVNTIMIAGHYWGFFHPLEFDFFAPHF